MQHSPNHWLTCQINGIVEYICRPPMGRDELRALAEEFREGARKIEAEIAKRAGRSDYYDGMFG